MFIQNHCCRSKKITKVQSQKLKLVQQTALNKKGAKINDEFVNRAKRVMVRLNRINLADFDRKRVAHCSIQLDRKDFKPDGEFENKNRTKIHYH